MPNTFTLIASSTVPSNQAAIEFTSIPATFTDICLLLSTRVTRSTVSSTLGLTFNNSSSGYSTRAIEGSGSAAASYSDTGSFITLMAQPANNATANTFGNLWIYISNYAGSAYKSVSIDSVAETNATTTYMNLTAGLWSNTSAITSVKFTEPNGGSNFVTYSTAYLYGIKNS